MSCVIMTLITAVVSTALCIYIDLLFLRHQIRNKAGIRYQYVSLREIFSPRCFWACCIHRRVVYMWLFALSVVMQILLYYFYHQPH